MKIKCTYCNAEIDDTVERCPNCGTANERLQRTAYDVPKTIEELKKWYEDRNLPPEDVTRFFIGENYEEPRAFGIYKDPFTENFVVYKNKDDGSRAIRYEGKDEAYAVNELYLKLKDEIQNQKNLNANKRNQKASPELFHGKFNIITFFVRFIAIFVGFPLIMFFGESGMACYLTMFLTLNPGIFIIIMLSGLFKKQEHFDKLVTTWHVLSILLAIFMFFLPAIIYNNVHTNDGYYVDSNEVEYYYYGSSWYFYDDSSNTWSETTEPDNATYEGSEYKSSLGSDFETSDYYESYSYYDEDWYESSGSSSSSSSSWDSGSDWSSSDSWDSGGSDWSSDW